MLTVWLSQRRNDIKPRPKSLKIYTSLVDLSSAGHGYTTLERYNTKPLK